ncbi:MAG: glycerophosphodiester phosphodiesterase family protein [Cyclobacteriaceae bacterium]
MLRLFIIFLVSIGFAASSLSQPESQRKIVIAHRGDHTNAPENTLKAFSDAIAQRLDYVEVDLRTTKDNQLVIMHDATIDRMTNGKGKINELLWMEISKYEIVDKNKLQLGKHRVPLFSEVLNLCKSHISIYLDFKDADVSATWNLIRAKGMQKSFVVYINHLDQFKSWRAIAPQVPLMVSLPDSVTSVTSLDNFLKIVDAEILDGDSNNYTKEMVEHATSKNRKVWLDFQQPNENLSHWAVGIQLGIEGFQSDKPRELKAWLDKAIK